MKPIYLKILIEKMAKEKPLIVFTNLANLKDQHPYEYNVIENFFNECRKENL